MTGTVKRFNSKRGYGFIQTEDGNEVFVHFTQIQSEKKYKTLKPEQKVTFEVGHDDQDRTVALNVSVTE